MSCIGGFFAIILGIMILAWGEEKSSAYGIYVIAGGVLMIIFSLRDLKSTNESVAQNNQQIAEVKAAGSEPDLPNPAEVIVEMDDRLKRGKFSVFLNGNKAGDIKIGETLKFLTCRRGKNMVQFGKMGQAPFKFPECSCFFDVQEGFSNVRLLISINKDFNLKINKI
jgi:hypothetical protein